MKTHISKLVLGVFFTLFCISTQAQEYSYIPIVKPGNQIWTEDRGYYGEDDYHFSKYSLSDEDTIIEFASYKKLYLLSSNNPNTAIPHYIGGLRENAEKQVFYKRDTFESVLLYDFSLSLGDTFTSPDAYPYIYEVISIDTINYEGIQRRVFKIAIFGFNDVVAKWIEGIGNFEGLLFDMNIRTTTAHIWGRIRCYEHNEVLLYHDFSHGGDDCITPLVGLNDIIKQDNSITLYPNPANNQVNISSENIINSIEIFNSLGQSVYKTNVKSREKIIDINSLSKGVYVIGVNTENGYIKKKLIKN
ncbi:MAG: T9SS type A sorting domain-containing protein [Bacteroidales bacterium]|nr:T9SS type A sorting domain-containing protein [Bacteroidales bacterium]MDD4684244.1 T9SS type A sorting domain-containing protein [Bacteroidales bacterium]